MAPTLCYASILFGVSQLVLTADIEIGTIIGTLIPVLHMKKWKLLELKKLPGTQSYQARQTLTLGS